MRTKPCYQWLHEFARDIAGKLVWPQARVNPSLMYVVHIRLKLTAGSALDVPL